MQRAQNTPAYVNAAFLLEVDRKKNYHVRGKPVIVFGNINPKFVSPLSDANDSIISGAYRERITYSIFRTFDARSTQKIRKLIWRTKIC